jgi:hypothetical protein
MYGLCVSSEVPLSPDPPVPPASAPTDVVIRFESLNALTSKPVTSAVKVTGEDAHVEIPRLVRFQVKGGREIAVDPARGASPRELRNCLLGPAFALVLHHRGLLPLHASGVLVDGRGVLFAGPSGIGKSTLAAHFRTRGYPILADDTAVLSAVDATGYRAWRGTSWLNLRVDAADRFGYRRSSDELEIDRAGKVQVPFAADSGSEGVPVAVVYVLGDGPPGIVRLRGMEAVQAVVSNTFAESYLTFLRLGAAHLTRWTAFAERSAIFAVSRRRGYDVFDDEAAALERHFTDEIARGA